ncbi:lipopolysaccharide biosynthesis protein [Thalassoroseus pseudoceratinae]|uniref:lipopolysaccharide biosynthesis protein n=1 Tax=Thalassoroseus pseudoceratinae TaxID=2713176 RepID=UPI001421DC5E|nr:lipopolysaccharide biosynthesis protein [Thalassoroseus pseudoceratinae]
MSHNPLENSYSTIKRIREFIHSTSSVFTWSLVGVLSQAVLQFAIVAIIGKVSTTAAVGRYAFALAVVVPVYSFLNMQLRNVLTTDTESQFPVASYYLLRKLQVLSVVALVGLLSIPLLLNGQNCVILWLVAASKSVESISDIAHAVAQRASRFDIIGKSLLARATLGISAFAATMLSGGSLPAALLTMIAMQILVAIFFDLPQARKLTPRINSSPASLNEVGRLQVFELAKRAFPLGIVMGLCHLAEALPRICVRFQMSEYDLGIYASCGYLLILARLPVSASTQIALPRLASAYAKKNVAAFTNLVKMLMGFAACLTLAMFGCSYWLGEYALTMLFNSEVAEHSHLLLILSVATGFAFASSYLGQALTAAGRFYSQISSYIVMVCAISIAAIQLIPHFGLRGMATAYLIGTFALLLVQSVYYRKTAATI